MLVTQLAVLDTISLTWLQPENLPNSYFLISQTVKKMHIYIFWIAAANLISINLSQAA